jgi:hypothetical protein
MLEMAEVILSRGGSAVLDACFPKKRRREMARSVAVKNGAVFACVELRCAESVIRKRLERRYRKGTDVSDGRWEIYHKQKAEFEEIDGLPSLEHIVFDGRLPAKDIIVDIEKMLAERLQNDC